MESALSLFMRSRMFSGQQSSRIGHTYKHDILLACKQNHVLLADNSISNIGHIDNIGVSL